MTFGPFCLIPEGRPCHLKDFFCSTSVKKFSVTFDINEKYFLGTDPATPSEKHLHIVEIKILNNFCNIILFKMFLVFEKYKVKT